MFANLGGVQLLTKLTKGGFLNTDIMIVEVPEYEILTDTRRNEAAVETALRPLKKSPVPSESQK
jgi:hypothetical protein